MGRLRAGTRRVGVERHVEAVGVARLGEEPPRLLRVVGIRRDVGPLRRREIRADGGGLSVEHVARDRLLVDRIVHGLSHAPIAPRHIRVREARHEAAQAHHGRPVVADVDHAHAGALERGDGVVVDGREIDLSGLEHRRAREFLGHLQEADALEGRLYPPVSLRARDASHFDRHAFSEPGEAERSGADGMCVGIVVAHRLDIALRDDGHDESVREIPADEADVRGLQSNPHRVAIEDLDALHALAQRRGGAGDGARIDDAIERVLDVVRRQLAPAVLELHAVPQAQRERASVGGNVPAERQSRPRLERLRVQIREVLIDRVEVELAPRAAVPGQERPLAEGGHRDDESLRIVARIPGTGAAQHRAQEQQQTAYPDGVHNLIMNHNYLSFARVFRSGVRVRREGAS